jgi:hypothetical protein
MIVKEFPMLRKSCFGISIILIGIMLVFALTGCDDSSSDPIPEQSITSGARIAYSNDGITWTAAANTTFNDENDAIFGVANVAWGNGIWVAPRGITISYSTNNGITWSSVLAPNLHTVYDIAWGNDKFVLVGQRNLGHGGIVGAIEYSTNGTNWTAVTLGDAFGFNNRSSVSNVIWGNGTWVASSGDKMAYSSNGINWTAVTKTNFSYISDIAFGNGRFVAVGADWPQ